MAALDQIKAVAGEAARVTFVQVRLLVLLDLIAEMERLQKLAPSEPATSIAAIVHKHTAINS